jgi:tripartite-type tricarboxylate transporter receptor subunit TctC
MFAHITVLVLLLAASAIAPAQNYPQRPIRLVVGFVPGGGADRTTRLLAQRLSETLGQTVIVDNRAGADGSVATEIVSKAAPDGYTLLVGSPGPLVTNLYLYSHLAYDPQKQLAPISLIGATASVLAAHPSTPFSNIRELVAWARAKPEAANYGSSGIGSMPHLSMELFKSALKINMVHVPYKGAGPVVVDLIGGRVSVTILAIGTLLPQIKAQKAKAIAVTSLKRSPLLPEVPTVDESGVPGFETGTWYGLLAPAGVPANLIAKINQIVAKSVRGAEIKESLDRDGTDAIGNSSAEFGAFIRKESAKWSKFIKSSGMKLD